MVACHALASGHASSNAASPARAVQPAIGAERLAAHLGCAVPDPCPRCQGNESVHAGLSLNDCIGGCVGETCVAGRHDVCFWYHSSSIISTQTIVP